MERIGAKMICPWCGAEMNHHADRLVYPLDAEEAKRVDPALGGRIEEVFSCPHCGRGAARLVN